MEDVSVSRVSFVSSAVLSIVGGESDVDADADLHELCVDSLGLAELLGLLEDGDRVLMHTTLNRSCKQARTGSLGKEADRYTNEQRTMMNI